MVHKILLVLQRCLEQQLVHQLLSLVDAEKSKNFLKLSKVVVVEVEKEVVENLIFQKKIWGQAKLRAIQADHVSTAPPVS